MKKKIKLIIAGSRSINDYKLIDKAIAFAEIDITRIKEVVSGGARGIDSLAKKWAENNGIKVKVMQANWSDLDEEPCIVRKNQYGKYNALAGINRNRQMADYADALLAIWDGESKGTNHMIECMTKLEKESWVYEL